MRSSWIIVFVAQWIIAFVVLVLFTGCATYVPVEIERQKLAAPSECRGRMEKAQPMQPFAKDASLTAVALNAAWAEHQVRVDAVARRNAARKAVCEKFVVRVARTNN